MEQNWPNPFNTSTVIGYVLPEPAHVSLKVYDLLGQEVTTLVEASQETGYHWASWNGKDEEGRPVSSGIYFYRLQAGSFEEARRMTLLR